MPSNRRSDRDFDVQLGKAGSTADKIRRTRSRLRALDKERRQVDTAILGELELLRAAYRRSTTQLVGAAGMRQLRTIRSKQENTSRTRIIRETKALLEKIGVDRTQLDALQRTYRDAARSLVSRRDILEPRPPRPTRQCGPWVTYTAPFNGFFWSFAWERSGSADTPVLTRHLDRATGRIGSSIELEVSDAGDNDRATADYYTGLNVWHTTLATGPLEVYLAFEFTASDWSGRVRDEFGFSDATYHQWAGARLLALDPLGPSEESQESRILHLIEFVWGEDDDWSEYAEKPRDIHWYRFKTGATFEQGRSVLLEAGIVNFSWFRANDESVTMSDDVDLRLDRIVVRTCRADPIL